MDYARIRQKKEGSLSVLAPRRQTTMRLPQTKTRLAREPPWGTLDPPFWRRKEGTLSPNSLEEEKNINKEN